MMKDRSLRRHQNFKAKIKNKKNYNSCIQDLPSSDRQALENNIEKLRKACVTSHIAEDAKKADKKPLRERKHDITMREQLNFS